MIRLLLGHLINLAQIKRLCCNPPSIWVISSKGADLMRHFCRHGEGQWPAPPKTMGNITLLHHVQLGYHVVECACKLLFIWWKGRRRLDSCKNWLVFCGSLRKGSANFSKAYSPVSRDIIGPMVLSCLWRSLHGAHGDLFCSSNLLWPKLRWSHFRGKNYQTGHAGPSMKR